MATSPRHDEVHPRHHRAAAIIQNQLYWRLVERDEKRKQREERRKQKEYERRNNAASVLQNELYWRPLERLERAIQREENLAARTIQEAIVNWFIRTRRDQHERDLHREARRQQLRAEKARKKAEQARKVHAQMTYKLKSKKEPPPTDEPLFKVVSISPHLQQPKRRILTEAQQTQLFVKRMKEKAEKEAEHHHKEEARILREDLAERARRRAMDGQPTARGSIFGPAVPHGKKIGRRPQLDTGREVQRKENKLERRSRLKYEAQADPERRDFDSHFLLSNHNSITGSVKERQELRKKEKEEIERTERIQRMEAGQRTLAEDAEDLSEEGQEEENDQDLEPYQDDGGFLETIAEGDEEARDAIEMLEGEISQAMQAAGDLLATDLQEYDEYEVPGETVLDRRVHGVDWYDGEEEDNDEEDGEEERVEEREGGEGDGQEGPRTKEVREKVRGVGRGNTTGGSGDYCASGHTRFPYGAPSARADPVGVTNDGSIMVEPPIHTRSQLSAALPDNAGASASSALSQEALAHEVIAARDHFNVGRDLSAQEEMDGMLSQAVSRASTELERPGGMETQTTRGGGLREPSSRLKPLSQSPPYESPFKDGYRSLRTNGDGRGSPSQSPSHPTETSKARFPNTYSPDEDFLLPGGDINNPQSGDKDSYNNTLASLGVVEEGSPQHLQENYQQSLAAAANVVTAAGLVVLDPEKEEMKMRIAALEDSMTGGGSRDLKRTDNTRQAVMGTLATVVAIIEGQEKQQQRQGSTQTKISSCRQKETDKGAKSRRREGREGDRGMGGVSQEVLPLEELEREKRLLEELLVLRQQIASGRNPAPKSPGTRPARSRERETAENPSRNSGGRRLDRLESHAQSMVQRYIEEQNQQYRGEEGEGREEEDGEEGRDSPRQRTMAMAAVSSPEGPPLLQSQPTRSKAEIFHEIANLPIGQGHGLSAKALAQSLKGGSAFTSTSTSVPTSKKEKAKFAMQQQQQLQGQKRLLEQQQQYFQAVAQEHNQRALYGLHGSTGSPHGAIASQRRGVPTEAGYYQSQRLTRDVAHRLDHERALMADLEEKKSDIERSIKLAERGPKVRLNKRGKIIDSEKELYRRALKKQEHLRTYSEKSGYFGIDSHAERTSQKETYRVLRLQKELHNMASSKAAREGILDFTPHRPDEGPSLSSTTSPRKQRQSQQSVEYGNMNGHVSLPMGAYDYEDYSQGAAVETPLQGVHLSGLNMVSEVFPLRPVN